MLKSRSANRAGAFAVCGVVAISFFQPAYAVRQATVEHHRESPAILAARSLFRPAIPISQALTELNRLVQKRPSWEVYLRRAYIRCLDDQYAAAVQDCEQSIKMQTNPAAYYLLFASCLEQGPKTWPGAVEAAKKLAIQYPVLSYPYECATFTTALQGDFDTSIEQLAAFDSLAAETGRDHYRPPDKGLIGLMGRGNLSKLMASIDKSPKQKASPQLLQALAAFFANDYARARALLGDPEKFKHNPSQGRISEYDLALALSLSTDQMLNPAAGSEEKALQLVRQTNANPASLTLLDIADFGLGQRDKALAFLDQCIEKESRTANHPRDNARTINMLYIRSAMHQKLGQVNLALADVEKISKLDPAQKKAVLEACELRLLVNEKEKALADLDKFIKVNQADAGARFLRAKVYVMDSKWPDAVQDLSIAIASGYHLEKALRARAACYMSLHKSTPAAEDVAMAEKFRVDFYIVRDISNLQNN